MGHIRKNLDPFDIPATRIPPNLSYQWVDLEDATYTKMAAAGWQPVPFDRHADFFDLCYQYNGFIRIGNSLLMFRLKGLTTEARAVEMDKAFSNIRASVVGKMQTNIRQVRVAKVDVPIILSSEQADDAGRWGISNESYIRRKVDGMIEGRDNAVLIGHIDGLRFRARSRRPRHRILTWLFHLISTDE